MGNKKKLHKSLQLYISKKLKKVPTIRLPTPPPQTHAAANWLFSACKYPKTTSFSFPADGRRTDVGLDDPNAPPGPAATLSDVERFLSENFHSLYLHDEGGRGGKTSPPPADLRSSDRFFASPSTSGTLVDESQTATDTSSTSPVEVAGDGVAVVTFSKDPYEDFHRSMQDMVDARHVDPSQPLDWDFMEELLFCYLELNDRKVHKYILKAFTDLTVSFRRRFPADRSRVPASKTTEARRRRKVAVESRRTFPVER
ncbi:transcription repressor OFP14-like [Typha angustifolia]|uniref:transcription repressor OFP14-like n=1 Tax=Typha angustifolia TaxID=59011 RepID=UPI003C2F6B08